MLDSHSPRTVLLLSVSFVICSVLFCDIIIQFSGSSRDVFVAGSELSDVSTYVRLYLYSRESAPQGSEILYGNLSSVTSSSFNVRKVTKVLIHGWFDSINGYFEPQLRKAYLEARDVNVIAVDWSKFTPVARWVIVPVGKYLAQFVDWMVTEVGMSLDTLHVIGFSLGAQLSGVVGEHMTAGRIGRITGLDPVGPTFGGETSGRLDSSDAQFVDIIHTCGGRFGYFNASGHVDFYPNGGTQSQPGCTIDFIGVCSHIRSYRLFLESISGHKFLSRKCGSWRDFTSGLCDSNFQTVMGEYVDHNAEGNFYLHTAGSYPYALS